MPLTNLCPATIAWLSGNRDLVLPWRSENGWAPPRKVVDADDTLGADAAMRLAAEGTGLVWRGDFQNARQLLQAMGRRIARRPSRLESLPYPQRFHQVRLARAQRARLLGMVLLAFGPSHTLANRRAPDVSAACGESYGADETGYVMPMTELLGVISAHEWRRRGIPVAALGERIHAHFGVFAPVRGEYLDLVASAPLPAVLSGGAPAFDIGTGTGVIAAILARRGVARVVATDVNPRALACARDNITRLGLDARVDIVETGLYPPGRAGLIVCNPPWLPGRPASALEQAIYDPGQRMLTGFLAGVREHLCDDGEAWLILSDLAERLCLRSRESLTEGFAQGGLEVVGRLDTTPVHPGARDAQDPLADARAAEVTSLWRLRPACGPTSA